MEEERKSEDKYIPKSAWSIWLHPMRTRRELEALAEEEATYAELLARSESDRARLFDERERLGTELDNEKRFRSREAEETAARISCLEREKGEMETELEEWRRTREELDNIALQIEKWEGMKERYEKRIEMLTLRLRDALGHNRFGQDEEDDALSGILEDGESAYVDREDRNGAAKDRRKALAEMLASEMIPETPPMDMADTDGQPNKVSNKGGYAAKRGRKRFPADDTDWLMPLPFI